jgi:S-DNA-T family DNA segregation ATPase FtsK/SpoIIIE
MARAAGIDLIIATQRPEASIVTPIIRSNLPGRMALSTSSRFQHCLRRKVNNSSLFTR